MDNYFKHDFEVKFYDNILSKNKNWQWFISRVENEFRGYDASIVTCDRFFSEAQDLLKIYTHLIQINSIEKISLEFSKQWLNQMDLCAKLFCGQMSLADVWSNLSDDFSRLFAIIVYVTKILNTSRQETYYFDTNIFLQDNIFKILDLERVKDKFAEIKNYIEKISFLDINTLVIRLERNLQKIEVEPNIALLRAHEGKLVSANAFSFQSINLPENLTWEVQYLFNMLCTGISNKKLIPLSVFEGVSFPKFSLWTIAVLDEMKVYFKNDIATFVIETIRFLLHEIVPSDKTIVKHFELEIEYLSRYNDNESYNNIRNSSLFVLNSLINKRLIKKNIKDKFMSKYLNEIGRFTNPLTIFKLKENQSIISNKQKDILKTYVKTMIYKIDLVNTAVEFTDYCKNEYIYSEVTDKIYEKTVNVFNNILSNETSGVLLANVFYEFMMFSLKINNENIIIDKPKLKNTIIQIQNLWQDIYYKKCCEALHTFSSQFEISNEHVNIINEAIMKNPGILVFQCIPLDTNKVLDMMADVSENALVALISNISIEKTYPKRKADMIKLHEVDNAFLEIIEGLQAKYAYKMLNYLEPQKYLLQIYEMYADNIRIYFSIFNKDKWLYERVKNRVKDYDLIDYDNEKIYSAHLLQLFPILENKIREFGQVVNIVPFKEKIEDFMHMKDASNVLQQILMQIYKDTKSFCGVEDLFFIYMCMYHGNFLNIRNEGSHGRDYLTDGSLNLAFKVSLICLELILNRLDSVNQ